VNAVASFLTISCLLFLLSTAELNAQDEGKLEDSNRVDIMSSFDRALDLAIQADGQIVVVGVSITDYFGGPTWFTPVTRFNRGLSLDTSFGDDGIRMITEFGGATAVAIQADGKILVSNPGSIARLENDGSYDTTFGTGGLTGNYNLGYYGGQLVIQADGKIVTACCGIGGRSWSLTRYLPDGDVDESFGHNGKARLDSSDFGIEKPDRSFYFPTYGPTAITILPGGQIITVGMTKNLDSLAKPVRFGVILMTSHNPDGSLDTSFGDGGILKMSRMPGMEFSLFHDLTSVTVDSYGAILIGGSGRRDSGEDDDFLVARFAPDGTLDLGFGTHSPTNGFARVGFADRGDYSYLLDLAVEEGGRIVAVGYTDYGSLHCDWPYCTERVSLMRLFSDGTLDWKTLSNLGANARANALATRSDRIFVAGEIGDFLQGNTVYPDEEDFLIADYVGYGEIGIGVIYQYVTSVDCADDVLVSNTPEQCGATVSYDAPLPADPGVVTCNPESGTFFDVGTTEVNCTSVVGDGTQNQQRTASCSLDVTIDDTEAPTIDCPDVVISTDPGQCSAVTDLGITVDDNCVLIDPPSATPASGSAFPLGLTPYSAQISDASGNVANCSASVTVVDETPPAIQCNTEGIDVRPGIPFSFQVAATDACSVASLEVTAFDCWQLNKAGKKVDKTADCVVEISGVDVNVIEPSGVGTIIEWTVEAKDGSDNMTSTTCQVVSQNPSSLDK